MAACSELEEKGSSSSDSLPVKIFLEENAGHCHTELSHKLSKSSKTGDLTRLSDDEFLHLLKEASTFNKPNNQESVLLKQLRKEVAETEPRENVNVDERSEHKHSKILLCNSTNSSSHRTLDYKKKQTKIREDSKSALNSDKNVQQSLSLQDLLSPDSKTKKSHKTQRTLSLSSEEAASIISDSLTSVTSKTAKKSNKQPNNSKNELNKSNLVKSKTDYSGSSFTGDSGQKRKYDALVQNSNLPYKSLINECDIPLPDEPRPENKGKNSSGSSIEIEMEEIKAEKVSSKEDRLLASHSLEKNKNTLQESNSKFYVDSNEVDTPVTFPLQLVSAVSDQNGSQFPQVLPWPRPLQVQTLLSNLPVESESFQTRDKQLLGADINGNPFSRNTRSLASFVSTTLLDYNAGAMVSESKNRKNKRLRNAVNKGVLSENIAGHRGKDDIDSLVQYINSSDSEKKGKSVKGSNQSQILSNKSMLHESDKKKTYGKDVKNCHKNGINVVKKKLSRSNSMENMVSNNSNVQNERSNALSYASNAILDRPLKNSKPAALENSNKSKLDINSNVESQFSDTSEKNKDSSSTDESFGPCSSIEQSPGEMSGFAADFYSTADVSSQTVEESGFLIVKKKQRKKHQGKRSESYRWRTAQTQRKKGMMIPLAESKCGKQDSRRKSTSSVPHSEHSSADNSDLDSVHSLPVRGSVPHPTQPHPHTTPSSSSSTPQASYADIARMPIPKLNSPSPCIMTYSTQGSVLKQQAGDQEHRKLEGATNSFSTVKRRVSDAREYIPVVNKNPVHTLAVEESTCSEVKVRSYAKSTREINTQTEPETSNIEAVNIDSGKLKKNDESPKNICSVCSCSTKKNCSCSKSQTVFRQKMKTSDIPPVIMDNMPAESNACNFSFGSFGFDEVLQMTPTKTSEGSAKVEVLCSDSEKTAVNKTASPSSSSLGVPIKADTHNSDLSTETSSPIRTVSYGNGKYFRYKDSKVNTKKFNLYELAHYLETEYQQVEKELADGSSNVKYYTDSAEEA